jgi:large subunit ribosomal protein L15
MPLQRRLPKRGFTNIFKKVHQVVGLEALNLFDDGETVNAFILALSGLIKNPNASVKLLANGELTKKLTVEVNAVSKAAVDKVKAAGGEVILVSPGHFTPMDQDEAAGSQMAPGADLGQPGSDFSA